MPASKKDPRTPEQWQEAADAAEFFLLLDSARQYGLLEGGPTLNIRRCMSILRRARRRGITPAPLDQLIKKFVEPHGDPA